MNSIEKKIKNIQTAVERRLARNRADTKRLATLRQEASRLHRREEIRKVIPQITVFLRDRGTSLDELVTLGIRTKRAAKPAVAKAKTKTSTNAAYRNPENKLQTWSGKGRMPSWMSALTQQPGVSKEHFRVRRGKPKR